MMLEQTVLESEVDFILNDRQRFYTPDSAPTLCITGISMSGPCQPPVELSNQYDPSNSPESFDYSAIATLASIWTSQLGVKSPEEERREISSDVGKVDIGRILNSLEQKYESSFSQQELSTVSHLTVQVENMTGINHSHNQSPGFGQAYSFLESTSQPYSYSASGFDNGNNGLGKIEAPSHENRTTNITEYNSSTAYNTGYSASLPQIPIGGFGLGRSNNFGLKLNSSFGLERNNIYGLERKNNFGLEPRGLGIMNPVRLPKFESKPLFDPLKKIGGTTSIFDNKSNTWDNKNSFLNNNTNILYNKSKFTPSSSVLDKPLRRNSSALDFTGPPSWKKSSGLPKVNSYKSDFDILHPNDYKDSFTVRKVKPWNEVSHTFEVYNKGKLTLHVLEENTNDGRPANIHLDLRVKPKSILNIEKINGDNTRIKDLFPILLCGGKYKNKF